MESTTLLQMKTQKRGYRTESYSGSFVRNLCDVVRHELGMGNIDIVDYVSSNYGILTEYLPKQAIGKDKKNTNGEQEYWDEFSDMCFENAPYIAEEIATFVVKQLKLNSIDEAFAIWLAPKESVIKFYNHGSDEDIDCYEFDNKSYLIMSDLGAEGALFCFKK